MLPFPWVLTDMNWSRGEDIALLHLEASSLQVLQMLRVRGVRRLRLEGWAYLASQNLTRLEWPAVRKMWRLDRSLDPPVACAGAQATVRMATVSAMICDSSCSCSAGLLLLLAEALPGCSGGIRQTATEPSQQPTCGSRAGSLAHSLLLATAAAA